MIFLKHHLAARCFDLLFPAMPRDFPYRRGILITLRSLHIFTAGTLLGGHIFGVPAESLDPWLVATIATGLLMIIINIHATMTVFFELRGIAIITKLILLLLVPVFSDAAVLLLAAALFIGVTGSHLPKRYRHKVFLLGKHVAVDHRNS